MVAEVEVDQCTVVVSEGVAGLDLQVMVDTDKCLLVLALIEEDGAVFKEFVSLHKIINYISHQQSPICFFPSNNTGKKSTWR